jgi:rhodanese-related sulfurtransferase
LREGRRICEEERVTDAIHSGGCACGAVRIVARGEPLRAGLCHCLTCRKQHGGPFGAFAVFPDDRVTVEGGEIGVFASSATGRRHFCRGCGAPLFHREQGSGEIELFPGSFDAPGLWPPAYEIWTRRREPWLPELPGVTERHAGDRPGITGKASTGETAVTITPARELVARANEAVETLSVEEAKPLLGREDVQFVDVREKHEWEAGHIPGAVHAPRGMLEFLADPANPNHLAELEGRKKLVLYCGAGGRSALAAKTLKDMGYANVAHMAGGFGGWQEAGYVIKR